MIEYIIVALLAIPLGFLLAYIARDELVQRRKWFSLLFVVSFLLSLLFYLLRMAEINLILLFVSVVTIISYIKSYDKKFVK